MVLNKNILILEDNLQIVSMLLDELFKLEQEQPHSFSIMVLTNHQQVERYINSNQDSDFDIILLDRDCKLNGSFHILDIERFGSEKVIAISSVPRFNQMLKKRGVTRIVLKDMKDSRKFAQDVAVEVQSMIMPQRLLSIDPYVG